MFNYRLIYFLIIFLLISNFSYAEITLEELVSEALENNPRIQAAYEEWKSQEYSARVVSSLDDPMLSYTYFGESIETRVGPQEHKYGISQKLPFPGKLNLKRKSGDAKASIASEKYEARKLEVITELKKSFYDLFWVDKAIQVTEEEKAILESLEKVAERKYEANLAPQHDAIKAQLEISALIDRLYLLKERRAGLSAKVNILLGRKSGEEIDKITEVKTLEFNYKKTDLQAKARDASQGLKAAQFNIEKTGYDKSLAKLEYLPDFTLGFDYIEVGGGETTQVNDGDDAWMATVKVNFPLWMGKKHSFYKEKSSNLDASRKMYQDSENNLHFSIEDLYFKIESYYNIISLYDTALVPQAEQSFDAARTAYESGKIDFLNWLDAERMLLKTRLAHYQAIVDYNKAIADLEKVVGEEL